jgi:glutathione S-transferase
LRILGQPCEFYLYRAGRGEAWWQSRARPGNAYICGDAYTLADVTLYGQLWFFCVTPGFGPPFPELLGQGRTRGYRHCTSSRAGCYKKPRWMTASERLRMTVRPASREDLPWVWAWYRRVEARVATKACDPGSAERGPLK